MSEEPPILDAIRDTIVLANRAEVLVREALNAYHLGEPPSEEWADAANEWLEPEPTP